MNSLFTIVTGIYMIMAIFQLFVAPRIGPNPYFGFKIGYTFSNREVWKRSNRFVGLLMFLHSIILVPFSFLGYDYLFYYIMALLVPLIVIAILGMVYASHQLEEIKDHKKISTVPIKPLQASFVWRHLGLILFIVLIFLMSTTYNYLPDKIAVHFGANGNPNGWAGKSTFFCEYLIFSSVYLGIIYLIVYAGKKYPILLHSGVMKIGRDTMFKSSLLALHLVMLIFILSYLGIFLYNITPSAKSSFINIVVVFSIILALSPIFYIVYRWKKERSVIE